MVAYNFQEQFADDVEDGIKTQTIRQKARCERGDKLQLFTGQRTTHCRKLRDAICIDVIPVKIGHGLLKIDNIYIIGDEKMDKFARDDGFADYEQMATWFEIQYGALPFDGDLIKWK